MAPPKGQVTARYQCDVEEEYDRLLSAGYSSTVAREIAHRIVQSRRQVAAASRRHAEYCRRVNEGGE